MDSQLSAALQYVRDNKSWTEVDEALAIEDMIRYRSPIEYTDDDISNAISALMDEYGREIGLPEGWWEEQVDVDYIFWTL